MVSLSSVLSKLRIKFSDGKLIRGDVNNDFIFWMLTYSSNKVVTGVWYTMLDDHRNGDKTGDIYGYDPDFIDHIDCVWENKDLTIKESFRLCIQHIKNSENIISLI